MRSHRRAKRWRRLRPDRTRIGNATVARGAPMPVVSTTKMTARQYLMLGEDPPGVRLELVDGEVAVSPSPMPKHSRVDRRLTRVLLNHIVEHDLGELLGDTDTIFGEHDVR